MDERWTQIRKLFRETLEVAPAQWESFLASTCPDPQMREKVLSMLMAYDVDDTFLEKPAADVGPGAVSKNANQPSGDTSGHNTTTQLVGTQVGPYEIKRSIARGGMGVVFEALDTKLDKVVALKMMSPALVQDPSFRQRFEQEARTLAKLEDPHFVRVNALIDDGPNTFIVMEYVDGITLAQHIRKRGPLAGKDAITVGLQLLQALSKAHRQGIIHRDLKPSNIMLTKNYEGRLLVKVLDFGIAKNIQPDGNQTRTVGAVGTLFYMSPEQARGLRSIDHRTDLYSLAVTLYEAVSGDLPYDTTVDEYTVRRQIVEGNVVPIDKRSPNIVPALATILNKALSTNPSDRYENAEAMRIALMGALNEIRAESQTQEIPATPLRTEAQPAEAQQSVERKKPAMALASVAIVAIFLMAAYFIYNRFSQKEPLSQTTELAGIESDSLLPEQPEFSVVTDTLTSIEPETNGSTSAPITDNLATNPPPDNTESVVDPLNQGTTEDPALNTSPSEDQGTALNKEAPAPELVVLDSISISDSTLAVTEPTEEENTVATVEPPLLQGTLVLKMAPSGSVYIDNELKQTADQVFRDNVVAGQRRIRVENDDLGRWVCEMNIEPDKEESKTINFEAETAITVVAEINSANATPYLPIYINGQKTPYTTPKKIRISQGLHSISLEMPGFKHIETVLYGSAGCFQKVGNAINIDAESIERELARERSDDEEYNPRVVVRMQKIE